MKPVNLALQGGGAHGAYTWGVLDALLEDGRFQFEAVSGTSAGAMNAVNLADGLRIGGREGARKKLADFWQGASLDGKLSEGERDVADLLLSYWGGLGRVTANFYDTASHFVSPYDVNPLDLNPLRDVLASQVDFEALRRSEGPKLFIAATNVHTGKVRVFHRTELTLDMVMASACLTLMFKAVMIDDIPYWDGGYMGNPVLFPFFTETKTEDVVLIQINPISRNETPKTINEIMDRINEITFNSALIQEIRAVDFVGRLMDQGRLQGTHYKKIRLHMIEADEELIALGADSKMNADFGFFQQLFAIGRRAGKAFIAKNYEHIGLKGTMAVKETLI